MAVLKGLLGLVLLFAAVAGGWYMGRPDVSERAARVEQVAKHPPMSTPRPGEPMDAYHEQLRQENEQLRAQLAQDELDSTSSVADIRGLEPVAKKETRVKQDPRWREAGRREQEVSKERRQKRYEAATKYARKLQKDQSARYGHYSVSFQTDADDPGVESQSTDSVAIRPLPFSLDQALRTKHLVKLEMSLDSDVPVTVFGTIITGPLTGALVRGGFKRVEGVVRVDMNYMRFASKDYAIKATAFDLDTGSAGITSTTNHRYVSRWAAVLASALLSGWRDAVYGGSGGTVVVSDTFFSETRPKFDDDEIAAVIVGEVGDRTAPMAEAYWNRPPTVKVHEAIGMMFESIRPL